MTKENKVIFIQTKCGKKNTPCFHKSLSWFWILDEEPQAVTLWNRE